MVYESNRRPTLVAYDDELMHYGVKGMKWGRRKAPTTSYGKARAAYKSAKRDYNRSFSRAQRGSLDGLSPFKTHRQANDARWDDAMKKGAALNRAESAYKKEKKAYKQSDEYKAKRAKAVKVGTAVAGTALAAYGAYKVSKVLKDKAVTKSYNAGKTSVRRLMAAAERSAQAGDWSGYAMSMQTARESAKRNAAQTNVFRNSTVEAAKYLYRSRRR